MKDELNNLVLEFKDDPAPDKLSSIVKKLDPTIRHTLTSMGVMDDPYLLSKSRVLAADAIISYDPGKGANLKTWVSQSLQPIRREKRMSMTPVKVPDRVVLDSYALYKAGNDFEDKHGRAPDLEELADASAMSIKRIAKVRASSHAPVGEATFDGGLSVENTSRHLPEAMDAIYQSEPYLNRKVLEHKFGYGNSNILSGNELADKLKLSPAAISKRAAALKAKILKLEKALERTS